MHSATKYLGGHGTAIGGVIVDGGTFDCDAAASSPASPSPTRATTAWSSPTLGPPAYILKARVQLLRDLGRRSRRSTPSSSSQGIETLSLRIERHVANAQQVAECLDGHDEVESVNYPGLPSVAVARAGSRSTRRKGAGAVLAFELAGRRRGGQARSSTR